MSSTAAPSSTPTNLVEAIDSAAKKATATEGISLNSFFASLAAAAIIFVVQFLLFLSLKNRLPRIYQPRTYLVPERDRTISAPHGLLNWLEPVCKMPPQEFIEKCGMDSFFFLRYLRALLKIFVPLALVILPILLPINAYGGRGPDFAVGKYAAYTNVTGLDILSFGNVRPEKTNRYWAHLVLAILVVVYVCYIFYQELRYYIKIRQHYLMSAEHRMRASAATVLVTGIPRNWLSMKALQSIYDLFPGGIKSIWLNRDYEALREKVRYRNRLAASLEASETVLIRKAKKAHLKRMYEQVEREGRRPTKAERLRWEQADDAEASRIAQMDGASSGNPHEIEHALDGPLHDVRTKRPDQDRKPWVSVPLVGPGLQTIGQGVGRLGKTVAQGLKKVEEVVDERINATEGLAIDDLEPPPGEGDHRADELSSDAAPARFLPTQVSFDQHHIHPALRTTLEDSPSGIDACKTSTGVSPGGRSSEDLAHDRWPDVSSPHIRFDPTVEQTHARGLQPSTKAHDDDEIPLSYQSPVTPSANPPAMVNGCVEQDDNGDDKDDEKEEHAKKRRSWFRRSKKHGDAREGDREKGDPYPAAFNEEFEDDDYGEPVWKRYLSEKDREMIRLPPFGERWMPSLPFIGKKVDAIYYYRKMVARLNVEIEHDQQHYEDYPLMNSAFIQFNKQIAAQMACQAVNHHIPKQMAPRLVEVAPEDVLWDNMSIVWWERYLRTALTVVLVFGLILGWAIPVTFTGLLSQVKSLTALLPWLDWISRLPPWLLSIVQGVLPPILLTLIMAVLPYLLRVLAKHQGVQTGTGIELSVQNYYFAFLFVQVFLIVSISSGITSALRELIQSVGSAPQLLAINLPRASNYFFSYMLLQAFTVSAGALLQLGNLIFMYVVSPMFDVTARQKWERHTSLPTVQWGTFFPVYTNLAAIGLIYSVISPLILVFNIITFSLFWVTYRYNSIYVTGFRTDTGGLLFPRAINQLFTGLYVMELCMIGLFFLVRDAEENVSCKAQAIVMIVVTGLTVIYQYLLHEAFDPLLKYLPVSLEQGARRRDATRSDILLRSRTSGNVIDHILRSTANDEAGENADSTEDDGEGDDADPTPTERKGENNDPVPVPSRPAGTRRQRRLLKQVERLNEHMTGGVPHGGEAIELQPVNGDEQQGGFRARMVLPKGRNPRPRPQQKIHGHSRHADVLTKRQQAGHALWEGIPDELGKLTRTQREEMVLRAYQHVAIRSKRPVIWIPRDALGVSDDEVYRTQRFSKHIWISNDYTSLNSQGDIIYRRSPPDYSELDLLRL